MAEYLSPGVYVEEFDSGSSPMQGAGTSTAGFVGLAEKGPISGAPVLVSNVADFKRKFGGFLQESEFGNFRFLAYAVNHFFANGGARAFIMRVSPRNAAIASEKAGDLVKISAKNPGAWGNKITVVFSPASKAKTQILENLDGTMGAGFYRVKNASGFNVGDIVEYVAGPISAYNKVASVDGNIVGFESVFEGDVVDINLLPKKTISTCEVDVEVKYDDIVEAYPFSSLNIADAGYIGKALAKSDLIDIDLGSFAEKIAPFDALKGAFAKADSKGRLVIVLSGGSNGTADKVSAADFIGKDNGPGSRTGIQAFLDNSDVAIMAVPGVTDANVQLSLVAQCENLGSRFAILDIPMDSKSVTDVMEHRDMVDSNYAAMYHPWLEVFDPLDRKSIFIPPSGSVAGIFARTDNSRGVHKAPANESVFNCTGLYVNYNTGEQDILNPKGVNLIRRLPGQGIRVWGARTCSSEPKWKYVNVRRLFIFLEETIKANTNWVVFEPNDELLWIRVRRTIEVFLEGVWRSGALAGPTAGDAFFVDIGRSTMSQDDIDNGRLVCVIGVAPVKPAEFVVFRITQRTGE